VGEKVWFKNSKKEKKEEIIMAEEKRIQLDRFTDDEVELMKKVFKNNDMLLKAIRKHFLQLPMNAVDLSILQTNIKNKKDLLKLLRKVFIPEIIGDEPLFNLLDLWMGVDLKNKLPEDAIFYIKGNVKFIDYLEQQLQELETGKNNKKILFKDFVYNKDKIDQEAYTDLITRNTVIMHVEQKLIMLKGYAERPEETEEELKKRQQKDSAQ
jgi:hypothetical protein